MKMYAVMYVLPVYIAIVQADRHPRQGAWGKLQRLVRGSKWRFQRGLGDSLVSVLQENKEAYMGGGVGVFI